MNMEPHIHSISSNVSNMVRQDIFPLEQWTITTRKGIILQSVCTCNQSSDVTTSTALVKSEDKTTKQLPVINNETSDKLCNICKHYRALPQLHNMPDMLFNENLLELTHYTGIGLRFTALDSLKAVKETRDPLQVAVSGEWQSARADFPYAKSVIKPFDWTFTTDYRGTLISAIKKSHTKPRIVSYTESSASKLSDAMKIDTTGNEDGGCPIENKEEETGKQHEETVTTEGERIEFLVEETDERIDVNKLKVKEDILFYADVPLYEDELADHGTALYSVKVRVMPKSLFILARFYLRIDNVLARINDTRIYHELNKKYLLREYTNREAKLSTLKLPVSILINPNELMNHLPIVQSKYEKMHLPVA